jgi:hypothetical protein
VEVGTHSPWVSRVVKRLGHEVIVANARQVKLISHSSRWPGGFATVRTPHPLPTTDAAKSPAFWPPPPMARFFAFLPPGKALGQQPKELKLVPHRRVRVTARSWRNEVSGDGDIQFDAGMAAPVLN